MSNVSSVTSSPSGLGPRDDASTSGPMVKVSNLKKYFTREDGSTVLAVDDVSLTIERGEFLVLLGPSGCGKTTLLRCIAGLESPDSGSIEIDGKPHYSSEKNISTPPEARGLGMIFQSYALWPHMTVGRNVAYPLRVRGMSKADAEVKVHEVLELLDIAEVFGQYPGAISGGQQQRVALARALVANNGLVLFDEPLSNVDAKVRERLRLEIVTMQQRIGFSAVYVTHDQDEAMELADRLAVLGTGKIVQLGSPQEVYRHPRTRYVASFIGKNNEIFGTVEEGTGEGFLRVRTDAGTVIARTTEDDHETGAHISVATRPERWNLSEAPLEGDNVWEGQLRRSIFLGAHIEHIVDVDGWGTVRIVDDRDRSLESGSTVWVRVAASDTIAVRLE